MCDCVSVVNEALKKDYEDDQAEINVGFSFSNNSLVVKPCGLAMQYHKKKKDGTYSDKKTTVSITPTFCPFCGTKYDE